MRLKVWLFLVSVCATARAQYDQPAIAPEPIPAPTPPASYSPEPYEKVLHRDEPKHREPVKETKDEPIPPPPPPKKRVEKPAEARKPPKKVEKPVEEAPKPPKKEDKYVVPQKACGISDILFVLDSTGSVRSFYEHQKAFMVSLVESLDVSQGAQHVGVVKYSSHRRMRVMVELDEVNEKPEVVAKVRELTFNGGITETGAALGLVKTALEKRRKDKKTAVVVLTDGFSFDHVTAPAKELHAIPDVIVYVAGLAEPVLREVLVEISGDESRVLLGEAGKAALLKALSC